MNADGPHDWDVSEPVVGHARRAARDGFRHEHVQAARDVPGPLRRITNLETESGALVRGVGELARENAELGKKVSALEAELKMEKARFSEWARTVDRDKSTMEARLEQFERRVTPASDASAPERRGGTPEPVSGEKGGQRKRGLPDTTIAVGVAVGGLAATAGADLGRALTAPDIAALAVAGLTVLGAGVPWWRKRKEDSNADRPGD